MRSATTVPLPKPWARPSQEIVAELAVEPEKGLDKEEVKRRRTRYGPNRLREVSRKSAWAILLDQIESLIVLLLVAAAVVSVVFGDWIDGVAILAVLVLNTSIGFFMESKAIRSMESLRRMEQVNAKVRRAGELMNLPAEGLVPGDIVIFEGGDIISADLRLVQASKLQVDESVLTGESLPVTKQLKVKHIPVTKR